MTIINYSSPQQNATITLEDESKTRSVRNAVRECTQTYMTERNRKHDAVLRSIFEGKRR